MITFQIYSIYSKQKIKWYTHNGIPSYLFVYINLQQPMQ
nr:MAG TPA: hypothetical protein [Caudoviricetes sp.]